MKEGTPVTWAFMVFIIVVYIGGYIWNAEKENDRLFDIATKQKETIEALEEENKQLHELTETMFQYIDALERGGKGTIWPKHDNNSPIYSKPL